MNCLQFFAIFALISVGVSDSNLDRIVSILEFEIADSIKNENRAAILHRFKLDYEYLDCQNQKLNREQVADSLLARKADMPFIRLFKTARLPTDSSKFYFIMENRFDKSGGKFTWNTTVEYFQGYYVFSQSNELGCCSN